MNEFNANLEGHIKKYSAFYESGVLEPEKHHRLVGRIRHYAAQAGVKPMDITKPFKETCNTEAEEHYTKFVIFQKQDEVSGMYYASEMDPPIALRMRVFTASLMRHQINVKLLERRFFFDYEHEGIDLSDTVLVIPDLMKNLTALGEWHRQIIQGLILGRYMRGGHVVFGRSGTEKDMENVLGDDITAIIASNYIRVKNDGE